MKKEKIEKIVALLERCDIDTLDAIYTVVSNLLKEERDSVIHEFLNFMNRLFG